MLIHITQIFLNLFLNLSLGILWNTIKSMNWTGMSSGDYQCRYLYIRWLSGWFRPTDPSRCASTWAGGWTPPQHGWQRVSGDPPLAADAPPDGSHTIPCHATPIPCPPMAATIVQWMANLPQSTTYYRKDGHWPTYHRPAEPPLLAAKDCLI